MERILALQKLVGFETEDESILARSSRSNQCSSESAAGCSAYSNNCNGTPAPGGTTPNSLW